MKKPIINTVSILALVIWMISSPLWAQQQDRGDKHWRQGPPSPEQQVSRMSKALDLSDEQSVQLFEVLLASRADHEALHARMMEEFSPEICALKQSTEAEILALLTPDQADSYLLMSEERQARNQGRRGHERPEPDCSQDEG